MHSVIDDKQIRELAPNRQDNGNKGTFGMTMIVAGSEFMTGAAVLCSSSALRSGAGLVRVYSANEALIPVKINCPCAMTAAFEDKVEATLRKVNGLMAKVTSVAIGPGIDEKDKRYEALLEFFIANAPSLVIDAGALNIISGNLMYWKELFIKRHDSGLKPAILTPHVGEFKRLLGNKANGLTANDLDCQCAELAQELSSIIVLKNNQTIISSDTGECYINLGNNSGMAKGGSGDVLTGLIGGFLAQGINPMDAAISAVYIHSEAGKIAAEEVGRRAMLPIDVIEYLPEIYERLGW